jgi:two-component system, cell cycle response regulator
MTTSDSLPIVLVVSADSYKSAFFKRTLKGLFYVIESSNSFTAVDWLKSVQATLIILDEKTLSNTWPIIADHIRNLSGYLKVPLLLITNNLKKNFLIKAMNMGISDFLNEPFDADEVFQRILVATQSTPVTKKITLMTKKFKKTSSTPPATLSSPQRFVITEDAIKEIATVQQKHRSLCLLLLEVDGFQKIAREIDEEGMQKLLSHVKHFFKVHQRRLDIILPQGNGRFLMMLPHTSHRAAMAIAETLHKEVQEKPFQIKSHSFSLSLSIGVATLDKNSALSQSAYDQFDSLLKKVDNALNKAKRKGNQIVSE